jgi:hypothetical protein
MENYPVSKVNKEGTLLRPTGSYYSNEYVENMCDLYLRDEIHEDKHRKLHKYYRLHAKQPHNIEMALAYDISCPKCSVGMLKQIGRAVNSHELGLYVCPICDKR